MYIWFLFEATTIGSRAKNLEDHKLMRLFEALEFSDASHNILLVRSLAVLFMDAKGFYKLLIHLDNCRRERKRVWDYHVVHYFAKCKDGFPRTKLAMKPFYVLDDIEDVYTY